jgi:hypothetical protein
MGGTSIENGFLIEPCSPQGSSLLRGNKRRNIFALDFWIALEWLLL